jgi:hypothetical protein
MKCPQCGAKLERIVGVISEEVLPARHTRGEPLPRRERLATFVACSACDFAKE